MNKNMSKTFKYFMYITVRGKNVNVYTVCSKKT